MNQQCRGCGSRAARGGALFPVGPQGATPAGQQSPDPHPSQGFTGKKKKKMSQGNLDTPLSHAVSPVCCVVLVQMT